MTTITVLPTADGLADYRAVSAGVEGTGPTPGRAIDALVAQTGPPTGPAVILLQPPGGDEFFSESQRTRLGDLMTRWRQARDSDATFPANEQAELDALIAAELQAATARSAAILRSVGT